MTEKFQSTNIDDINLDLENPRVPLSIRKEDENKNKEEINKDILEYLIKTGSLTELMLSIGENGFFSGEPLLLIPDESNEGKLIVVEGNRRVAALKLLHDPSLATVSKHKILEASELSKQSLLNDLTEIPSIVFSGRSDILKYLGYRHITGIKDWKALEKARYMETLYSELKTDNNEPEEVYKEIAKSIGSRPSYVERILKAYGLYLHIEKNDFFDISGLDDQQFHFVNLSDSLNKTNVANYLLENNDGLEFNKEHLKEWTEWLFKENAEGKTRLKGTSSDLKDLDLVLSNPKSLAAFRSKDVSLSQAVFLAEDVETILAISLEKALNHLGEAYRVLIKIDDFNKVSNFDENILDIRKIAKEIFESKKKKTESIDDDVL